MSILQASTASLALLAAAAMIACSSGSDAPPSAAQEPDDAALAGTIIQSGHRAGLPANRNTLGHPDAPIVIVEYSDFL